MLEPFRDSLQIGDERVHRRAPLGLVSLAQDRRRVRRQRDQVGQVGVHPLPAVAPDADLRAEQRLRRGGPETDQRLGPDQLKFGLQDAMRQAMIAAVEQITGRRVQSFMSANDLDQNLQVEVFVLSPAQDAGSSGLGG